MEVYKIYNDVNDKIYIGATKRSAASRFKEHCRAGKANGDLPMYRDMYNYGIDKFHFEVLFTTDSFEDLYRSETENIEKYDAVFSGYNTYSRSPIRESWDEFYSNLQSVMRTPTMREKISIAMRKSIADRGGISDAHRQHLSESARHNKNGIGNPSHSIPCYCVDEKGEQHHFRNYKDGGLWWYQNYNPFNHKKFVQVTMQRKIIESITTGSYRFMGNTGVYPKWFKEEDS